MVSEAGTTEEPSASKVGPSLLKLAPRFLLVYAVLLGIYIWASGNTRFMVNAEVVTATVAGGLMKLTGVAASRVGTFIDVPGRQLVIGPDCTAISILVLFVALIAAYPAKISSRLLGILGGTLVVLAANLVRLVAVAHISRAPDAVFNTAHDFLFQVGMVAVALGVWAYWLSFVRRRES